LKILSGVAGDEPNLIDESVLLEVTIADRVCNPFSVGLDLRAAHGLDGKEVVDGGDAGLGWGGDGAESDHQGERKKHTSSIHELVLLVSCSSH